MDSQNAQGQDCGNADLCLAVQLHVPDQRDGEQTQGPVRKSVDRGGGIRRARGELLGDAGAPDERRAGPRPEVVDGLALRHGDEHVHDVEDQDDGQHGPDDHALPLLRADAQQEDADRELEEDRGQDVGDLAEPAREEGVGETLEVDGEEVLAGAVVDAEEDAGAE